MPINNQLKIAVVSTRYGLVGGSERFAREVTERLSLNPDYSIHVFTNQWKSCSDRIVFHKYPIIKFPRFFQPISTALFVQKMIANQNFDIIHTHERVFEADIYSIHGLPHKYWIKNIRKKKWLSLFDYCTHRIEKKMVTNPRCKHLLPVSNSTKQIFSDSLQVSRDNMQVVPPGVDINKYLAFDRMKCRHDIRERFGLNISDIVVLFVGMNFEIKGLSQLMKAISKTYQKNPSVSLKLIVVGKGNIHYYQSLASQLNIQNHIIFTGIIHEEIEKIYLASDIFSMLSEFDTFGMTVLEAMAASIPVIISNNVGAKDIVRHGINGFVVEASNTDMISACINDLLNDTNRNKFSKAAYQTALEFTWDKTTDHIRNIYDSYR
jgi:UDP-glucose:(heptosyl)LPS alpha-1,3-glucosyltransferase